MMNIKTINLIGNTALIGGDTQVVPLTFCRPYLAD